MLGFFSHHWDKIPDRNQGRRGCFGLWIKMGCNRSQWRSPSGMNERELEPERLSHVFLPHRPVPLKDDSPFYLCEKYPSLASYCIQSQETRGMNVGVLLVSSFSTLYVCFLLISFFCFFDNFTHVYNVF